MISCWLYACKFEGKAEYWREIFWSYWYTNNIQNPEKSPDEGEDAKERAWVYHHLQTQSRKLNQLRRTGWGRSRKTSGVWSRGAEEKQVSEERSWLCQERSGQRSDCWVWLAWGHQGPQTKRSHESDPFNLSLRWKPCPSLVPHQPILTSHHVGLRSNYDYSLLTSVDATSSLWQGPLQPGPKQPFLPCFPRWGLLSL